MSVDRAVQDTVEAHAALVRDAAASVPKAWGALAARGTLSFRELTGRAPTDIERRAIWAALWGAVEATRTALRTCGHAIDPAHHAVCGVCGGLVLCVDCARAHYCTSECREGDCFAGLCVKEVRDGIVSERFGIG